MKKYIELTEKLRARVKYDKTFKHYEIRLQKLYLFLWISTDCFVDVKEGFWGEDACGINPLTLDYIEGGSSESYKTGTMDIKARAKKLCEDYIIEKIKEKSNRQVLTDLTA